MDPAVANGIGLKHTQTRYHPDELEEMPGLVGELFDGPLDIIGDVHGECGTLCKLLDRLGYDGNGDHPEGRRLVFVGDLVDRGPDSPGHRSHWMPQALRDPFWSDSGSILDSFWAKFLFDFGFANRFNSASDWHV